ncbi:hypothetical protein C8Q74DRAFT_1222717 [Fomes fomentarius]|nr:hypothetical protein C8Q74DRAFT_1222717 [Fomes fomentarius]
MNILPIILWLMPGSLIKILAWCLPVKLSYGVQVRLAHAEHQHRCHVELSWSLIGLDGLAGSARQSPGCLASSVKQSPPEALQAWQNSPHWKPHKLGKTVPHAPRKLSKGHGLAGSARAHGSHMAPTWPSTQAKRALHMAFNALPSHSL